MLDMPFGAVWLLDALAIKYQVLFIDGDEVRVFAETIREFAKRVAETNDEGSKVVHDLAATWEGASYQGLVAAWARMSGANMAELQENCELVASALDAAAVMIEITQAAVLAELAALGAAFIGSMIASAATFGASAAVSLAVRAAANRLISAMEQVLVAYLLNEVLARAIAPLEEVVGRIVNGYGHAALADYLGPSNVFRMDPAELERAATTFDHLAGQMNAHGVWLTEQLEGLFPGGDDDVAAAPPYGSGPPQVRDPVPASSERATHVPSHADGSDTAVSAADNKDGVLGGHDPSATRPYHPAAAYAEPDAQASGVAAAPGGAGPGILDGQDLASRPGVLPDPAPIPDQATEVPWQRPDAVAPNAEPWTLAAQNHTTDHPDIAAQRDDAALATSFDGAAVASPLAGQGPPSRPDADRAAAPPKGPTSPVRRPGRRRDAGRTPWTRDRQQAVAAQQDSARIVAPDTPWTPWRVDAPKGSAKRKPATETTAPNTTNADHDKASADQQTGHEAPRAAVLPPPVRERAGS